MSSNIVKVVGNIFVFVFVLNKTFHTHLMLLFKLKKKKVTYTSVKQVYVMKDLNKQFKVEGLILVLSCLDSYCTA